MRKALILMSALLLFCLLQVDMYAQTDAKQEGKVSVTKDNYDRTTMHLDWQKPANNAPQKYLVVLEKRVSGEMNIKRERPDLGANVSDKTSNFALPGNTSTFGTVTPELDFSSDGEYFVFLGPGLSADFINLIPGKDYFFKIYGFTDAINVGKDGSYQHALVYEAGPFPTLSEELPENPKDFMVTGATVNSLTLQWNMVPGAEQYFILGAENPIQSGDEINHPADKYTYFNPDMNNDYNVNYLGDAYPFMGQEPNRVSNAKVVYNGEGGLGLVRSVTITGLNRGTTYFFKIYTVNKNASNGSENYYTVDNPVTSGRTLEFGTAPGVQDYNVRITKITSNTMDLAWTRGSGTGSFVVVKEGSPIGVSDMPVSGRVYNANSNYNLAPSIGGGKVVALGPGVSTSVTGITGLATYYIHVFGYTGEPTEGTAGFNTNTSLNNPISTKNIRARNVAGDETYDLVNAFQINDITPNPAKDKIMFTVFVNDDQQPFTIEIYNTGGERVISVLNYSNLAIGENPFTVPFTNLAAGNYILKIVSGNDIVVSPFIVIP